MPFSPFSFPTHRRGFTLIELLVVIAIIAILSVVVILTLNPAELLRQSRDSSRLSDMATLTNAISVYQEDLSAGSLGAASTTYISIPDPSATSTAGDQCQGLGLATSSLFTWHCAASSTYQNVDGTGWIPLTFSSMSTKSPLGSLPVDPTNTTSSGLFYTYQTNGTQYELTAVMESQKYQSLAVNDAGTYADLYEKGSSISLALMNYGGSGLLPQGWWRFANSSNLGLDSSPQGNTLTINGSITQTTGSNAYVPNAALLTAASSQFLNRTDANLSAGFPGKNGASGSVTVGAWVKPGNQSSARDVIDKGCSYALIIGGSGYAAKFQVDDNGYGNHQVLSSVAIPAGSWSYIVGVWTASTGALTIYVNGVNVTSGSANSATMNIGTGDFQIGKTTSCFTDGYYDGTIAEPFAIATALSAAQIQNIYSYGVIDL